MLELSDVIEDQLDAHTAMIIPEVLGLLHAALAVTESPLKRK